MGSSGRGGERGQRPPSQPAALMLPCALGTSEGLTPRPIEAAGLACSGVLDCPRAVVCQEHSQAARRPGDTACALSAGVRAVVSCLVAVVRPLGKVPSCGMGLP